MKDYVVTVLYQDVYDETQQELFEVSAKSKTAAEKCIRDLISKENGTITYIKVQ